MFVGYRVENLSENNCLMAGMEMLVHCQTQEEVAIPPAPEIIQGLQHMEQTVQRLKAAMNHLRVRDTVSAHQPLAHCPFGWEYMFLDNCTLRRQLYFS